MNTLWKEGKTDEAMLAVQNMEKRGIVGSGALYSDFARCLCSAGRCQEALIQVLLELGVLQFCPSMFLHIMNFLSLVSADGSIRKSENSYKNH